LNELEDSLYQRLEVQLHIQRKSDPDDADVSRLKPVPSRIHFLFGLKLSGFRVDAIQQRKILAGPTL